MSKDIICSFIFPWNSGNLSLKPGLSGDVIISFSNPLFYQCSDGTIIL